MEHHHVLPHIWHCCCYSNCWIWCICIQRMQCLHPWKPIQWNLYCLKIWTSETCSTEPDTAKPTQLNSHWTWHNSSLILPTAIFLNLYATMPNQELFCSYYADAPNAANVNWEYIHMHTTSTTGQILWTKRWHSTSSICLKGKVSVQNTQLCYQGQMRHSEQKLQMLQIQSILVFFQLIAQDCTRLHKNQYTNRDLDRGDWFPSKTKQRIHSRKNKN